MKNLISIKLRESLLIHENLKFNNGTFNKDGANTIYLDNKPIVDFGVSKIGTVVIDDQTINNAIYLQGGYNASEQGKGYGSLGIKFIFDKLPKIENLILQCFDTACPFWLKKGAIEITNKKLSNGHVLRTLVINREQFKL